MILNKALCDCQNLKEIYVKADTPPTVDSYAFSIVPTSPILYVPIGTKEAYAAKAGWSEFTKIVEMESTCHNLAVTAAGYATLYLGFNTEIPEGVEVYYAKSVKGDLLNMEQITGYLPANTGVIVKANEGTYSFNITDEEVDAIEDNLLHGTVEATTITAEENTQYYVLSKVDGVVGMYLAQLTDGGFLNNANKAYLPLSLKNLGVYDDELDTSVSGAQLGTGYRFDFGGTTGVDEVKGENGTEGRRPEGLKSKVKGVYDLQGRVVKGGNGTVKGIYIINGKKTLIK